MKTTKGKEKKKGRRKGREKRKIGEWRYAESAFFQKQFLLRELSGWHDTEKSIAGEC